MFLGPMDGFRWLLLLLSTASVFCQMEPEAGRRNETTAPDTSPAVNSTYDLCGTTTKCICVNTVVRRTIQCEGGRLRGQLPSKIAVPQDFTAIDFSSDSIPFIRSDTFDGTYESPTIVRLDFSKNDIEYVEDGAFEMFQALRELVLSRNRIANLTLGAFRNLRQLETLDLSYNNIAYVDMDVLYPCSSLRRLSFRFNPLPLTALADLLTSASTNLEDLDLHGLNLDEIPDDLFRTVPYVEKLIVSGNRLETVPGEALSQMRRLTSLDLSDNFIRVIRDIDFQGLESLEELQLNRIRNLERIENGAFVTLRNLRIFSCSFNAGLRTIQSGAFPEPETESQEMTTYDNDDAPLPDMDGRDSRKSSPWHLEEVHLRQNALTTLPRSLLPWTAIRYVDLSENPWTCDCRMQWMKQISWDLNRIPPIRCEMPRSLRRRLITEIVESDFRCESLFDTHVAMSMILLLTTVSLIVTVICLLACHKMSWCSVCRSTFQRRYSKLKSTGSLRSSASGPRSSDGNKANNNDDVVVVDGDVEMNLRSTSHRDDNDDLDDVPTATIIR